MRHDIDPKVFGDLTEESQDLHSDAMRTTRRDLDDYVVAAHDTTSHGRTSGTAAAVAGAAGVLAVAGASNAWGQGNADVQALQTAASLENLAVFTYKTALTLPFIGGGESNPVVKAFAEMTMKQHAEHGQAFNAAAVRLGGKEQTATNPKYTPVVQDAVPTLTDAAAVVGLAITLETVATQTYVKNVSQVSTAELRQLFGSVAGVESQHAATLLAVQALLKGGAPELIAIPTDVAALPDAAGSVGFPDALMSTDMASPVEEGAVA